MPGQPIGRISAGQLRQTRFYYLNENHGVTFYNTAITKQPAEITK